MCRVDGLPLVADVSNVSIEMVSSVGGGLDPAIGEGDHIGALHHTLNKNQYTQILSGVFRFYQIQEFLFCINAMVTMTDSLGRSQA